jgi:hypothetical protein
MIHEGVQHIVVLELIGECCGCDGNRMNDTFLVVTIKRIEL